MEIVVENDSLFTILNDLKQYVNHYHYDTFELVDVIDNKVDTSQIGIACKITFKTIDCGDLSGAAFKAEPTIDAIIFKRTPNTNDVSNEILETNVGEY